ncbi:MAG: carboxymuconolactone decarboxylase family protein [Alphaproteobacteria bacterium]|nr:carboxymuconolactone decarboxylase family protein [Alphaproteobacteria bacterium]MDP1671030.1 carboxymuconolactone decarboxylase family protein [Alphaproteobacteria bacterium]
MSDMTHAERRARGLEVISSLTGSKDPEKVAQDIEDQNGALGSLAIDFALGDVWTRPGISRRDRSLIVIAIVGALNQLEHLKVHVRGAINHGVTPEEVREVMTHMCGYAGFPRALDAMKAANEVLAELGHAPKDGKLPPAERLSLSDRRKRAAPGLAKVSGGKLFDNFDITLNGLEKQMGPIGIFAADFIFGDIWERSQLSKRDRSLIVNSFLGALGRQDELKIHIPGAFRHGLSKEEIQELIVTLAAYAGFPFAVEATHVLHEHLKKEAS